MLLPKKSVCDVGLSFRVKNIIEILLIIKNMCTTLFIALTFLIILNKFNKSTEKNNSHCLSQMRTRTRFSLSSQSVFLLLYH